jgi:enoyl-CoA hydratase/carnithine racemase
MYENPSIQKLVVDYGLYKCFTMEADSAIEYEADGHLLTMLSDDMKEGIVAFKEKRSPVFPSNQGSKTNKDK